MQFDAVPCVMQLFNPIFFSYETNNKQECIPLPPITEGDAAIEENPSFQFSHAECLLYALIKLGEQECFAFNHDSIKLKEFRKRLQHCLQYLERGMEG